MTSNKFMNNRILHCISTEFVGELPFCEIMNAEGVAEAVHNFISHVEYLKMTENMKHDRVLTSGKTSTQ